MQNNTATVERGYKLWTQLKIERYTLPYCTCKNLQDPTRIPWPSMTIHDHALEMNEIHGIHGTWKRRFWCELWSPWAGRFDNVLTQCHTGWDQASARRSAKASGSNRLNEISMSPDHFVLVSSSSFIYVRLTSMDCVSYILCNNTYILILIQYI